MKFRLVSELAGVFEWDSLVDLGCGDVEVLRGLHLDRYLGVDVSGVVIERNRRVFPEWKFVHGPISELSVSEPYDAALCLDVLIHQRRRRDFEGIVAKLDSFGADLLVVSGYETEPDGWNVFFHEPLSQVLARELPDFRFAMAGKYRNTTLFIGARSELDINEAVFRSKSIFSC